MNWSKFSPSNDDTDAHSDAACTRRSSVVERGSSRLTRALDVEAMVAAFDLDDTQQSRLLDHRRLLACFWLMMLLPGNGGFHRNPSGSTEDQARHLLTLLR